MKIVQKNTVEETHPEYNKRRDQWQRARDVVAGRDAVHSAGTLYLQRLKDESTDDYNARKKRAGWYGASWRTVAGLVGMMFRKPATIEVPEALKPLLEDIDMAGTTLDAFLQDAATENMTVSRVGILVDYPEQNPGVVTKAQAEAAGLRPKMVLYKTESIINWKHRRINNAMVLSQVRLKEQETIDDGEWGQKVEDRWRVLDLDENNLYRVRVFKKAEDGTHILVGPPVYPQMDGKPMDHIPFYPVTPEGLDICPHEPVLLDLFDTNLQHYVVSADYEHGCHFTGLPTPWIAGYTPEVKEEGQPAEKLYIGSAAAWVFPDPNAKAQYLEFTGQGLATLEKNLERKEAHMAVLGARMLAPEKKQADTATTTAITRSGEYSTLASMANAMSLAFTKALQVFCKWAGVSGDVKFELNRDFMPVVMDNNTLTGLVAAWQSGAISYETLFDMLQRGDIVDPKKTAEEERAAIDAAPPPVPTGTEDPLPSPGTREPVTGPKQKDPEDVA